MQLHAHSKFFMKMNRTTQNKARFLEDGNLDIDRKRINDAVKNSADDLIKFAGILVTTLR